MWSKNAVFYQIYPLGFSGAPMENDFISDPVNRLDKIISWIPYLKTLGCNALYLGPVFESDAHGYDTKDYFLVDRRLGTNNSLMDLSRHLHANGMELVLDTVFNHVGRNFWAFLDLKEKKELSAYKNWFSGVDFSRNNDYDDGFYYEGWYDAYNLVKLNLQHEEVKKYLFEVLAFWIQHFEVDGLRLDVAEIMDKGFLHEMSVFVRDISPDCWLLGEVITGDYRQWVNPDMLDSCTNYEVYKALYESHNNRNYFDLAQTLNREYGNDGVYKDLYLYNFADNHDTTRIASILANNNHLIVLYTILFTLPGIPSIYYGSEWGILGVKGQSSDDLLRPEITGLQDISTSSLAQFIRVLADIRMSYPLLYDGAYKELYVADQQLIFQRSMEGVVVIIAVNASHEMATICCDTDVFYGAVLIDQLDQSYEVEISNKLCCDIPAYSARIFTVR